ncbi:hypothetical protein DFR72_104429 [Lentzea flaviverrucosa]|uniref:Uncharacterized protein n=1 Tax=Lentzea flaviverrucosa TaxID=200379 RepID=A0A1H9M316_9PSEU|nr:hypothetical protein DFR72_104429 [Lentzea flaviverrucosa]SER18110.1 hypothetical protein SAMN05216195_104197 [Lentzea flaviverrucosa]
MPPAEYGDTWGMLEQVRLRSGMWVRERQLRDLQATLLGYGIALEVHGIDEPFPFYPGGHFAAWLHERFGWGMSCGWAGAIEEISGTEDPLDLFFRLADEYRGHLPART